jgi:dipeptidyl aminopeptidase/acylaminoacyl peptidase
MWAQQRPIEIADIHRWKKADATTISNDARWVAYVVAPYTEGDSELHLYNATTTESRRFERGAEPRFSYDAQYLFFKVKPHQDSIKALRRKKVKEDEWPKDTLIWLHLASGVVTTIPRVKAVTVPDKWNDWVFVHLEPLPKIKETPKDAAKPDTAKTATPPAPTPKIKKENKENGSMLLLWHLPSGRCDTIPYVINYSVSEASPDVVLVTTGQQGSPQWKHRASVAQAGVYHMDMQRFAVQPLWRGKAKFPHLAINKTGQEVVFLLDSDTTKARIRPFQLAHWHKSTTDSAQIVAGPDSRWLPEQPADVLNPGRWMLSEHYKPQFSHDGESVYIGVAPPPLLQDTLLLTEEIVQVEVWASGTPRLYTELENRLEADKKRTWPVLLDLQKYRPRLLFDPKQPSIRTIIREPRNSEWVLATDYEPYAQTNQWEGESDQDVFVFNTRSGAKKQVADRLRGSASVSPDANYVLWWSQRDTAWHTHAIATGKTVRLTHQPTFANEEHDTPGPPDNYGSPAWIQYDQAVLLYDRYDIWQANPQTGALKRLTEGRERRMTYRYIRTDPEAYSVRADQRILLHAFDHTSKTSGYAWLDLATSKLYPWMGGPYVFTRQPVKARRAAAMVFTVETFDQYPDLRLVQLPDSTQRVAEAAALPPAFSRINPQQSEYRWPTIESVRWYSLQGDTLRGMLIKPADFDPSKTYPMIVNFYERQSDELMLHRPPTFGRSQINFTQYASRGYLVFVPDIPYRIGYPAESAYDAVVSGVTHLMGRGFVDPKRIGLQGHSWGGYQTAYLITRTNLFACAEAGAPVANMTSAYGGIRWESGLNRQFQYEQQQSRIGGTLWEKPAHYIDNSPLFALDKVQTPLLILHNDADGAVPWQQGIELFTGLRRLGKPTWMLNYNDEPHWPVKLQNRVDFQTRMQQFFDHYLMGAPMPRWMERGVPPIEKGLERVPR